MVWMPGRKVLAYSFVLPDSRRMTMSQLRKAMLGVALSALAMGVQAQFVLPSAGTLVLLPAQGEVKRANDQALATLMVEEQDKDKAVAASRVNLKMKQGTQIVKQADPQAVLTTRGYYTYPIYSDEPQKASAKPRQPVGWRVGQYLDVLTPNLATLPKTVATAQSVLALNGLVFSLSDNAARKLDDERIVAATRNLAERVASVARALGRNPADVVIESMDFDGAGAMTSRENSPVLMKSMRGMSADMAVEEPSFEAGETTLRMQVIGKIRFK
jgi:predicted secreted protein